MEVSQLDWLSEIVKLLYVSRHVTVCLVFTRSMIVSYTSARCVLLRAALELYQNEKLIG